ncbi:MAG: HEAT repeat domain-containing protein [Planctomycetes bacterium]|nr:HEAT repeat domain-containing protein [Planctomycetota bacterium]
MRDAPRIRLAGPLLLLAALLAAPSPPALPAEDGFEAAAKAVNAALGGKDPGALADALWDLRSHDGAPAARLLLAAALRRPVPDFVLDAAMDALGAFRSAEAAGVLAEEAGRARGDARFPVLEALGRLKHDAAGEALLPFLEDPDPRLRTAAVRALADRKSPSPAARAGAEKAAADPDPRVRSAAVAALAGWRGSASGLPLLGRLVAERGRLFGDAWRGLMAVTGERRPPDPEKWADWWRTMPGEEGWHFDAPPPEPPAPSLDLAGLLCWSRRVVFVLDTSEGMADRPGYRLEEILPAGVKEKGGKALEEWAAVKSRLDHAVMVLRGAVEALPADASFDLHFGDEAPAALFRRLEPATAGAKERAAGRLKGLNGKARQDFGRLIRSAWAGEPDRDPVSEEAFLGGADTVVYVGTALPSWGPERDPGRIVSSVRRWNRVRQVRFLGVGVGTHGSDLLAGLASLSPAGGSASIP